MSQKTILSFLILSVCIMIARVSLFYYLIHKTTSITVLINGAPVTISNTNEISKACSKMDAVTSCHDSIMQQLAKAQTIAHNQFNKCSHSVIAPDVGRTFRWQEEVIFNDKTNCSVCGHCDLMFTWRGKEFDVVHGSSILERERV